jgi:hypothetical protein
MGDDIEIQFRGGNPKKWHSGKMRIQDADCAAIDQADDSAIRLPTSAEQMMFALGH